MKHQNKLLKAAIEAAELAGDVIAKFYRKTDKSSYRIKEKKGEGLVTAADVAAEVVCLKRLLKDFPSFGIVAEESGIRLQKKELGQSEGRWIVDPLDGTTNFIHGFPMFCVSVAAEVNGVMEVGVIYHPILKELYTAVRGQGAMINRKKMRVSATKHLKDALMTTGFAYSQDHRLHKEIENFERISNQVRAVRRPGSAALDLAYTARGIFDGFWERNLRAWDVAAGKLLVEEAGGKIGKYNGSPFTLESGEILATNPQLFPQLVDILS